MGKKSKKINNTTSSIPEFSAKKIYTIPMSIQFIMNSDGHLSMAFEDKVKDSNKEQFLLNLFDKAISTLNVNASQVWMVRG